jgi:hypothetical protein
MITISKKFYVILLASTISFGLCSTDNDPLKPIKEILTVIEKYDDKLLSGFIADQINDESFDPEDIMDDKLKGLIPLMLPVLKSMCEPAYKKFPATARKLVVELVDALKTAISQCKDQKKKEQLEAIIKDFEPLVSFAQENSNAGLFKQFTLLDLSGKIFVGVSVPLAAYGVYAAYKTYTQENNNQERLV